MKKVLLSVLLGIVALTSFAQNWVEVGVDTQYGPMFLPNNIEYIDDSTVLMGGYSYDYNTNAYNSLRNGFFKSIDGGLTWDTTYYFNSAYFLGDNYNIAIRDTSMFIIKGTGYMPTGPNAQYGPTCNGYQLNMYNTEMEFSRTLFEGAFFQYSFLLDVVPISPNTLGLKMDYQSPNDLSRDYFARFNLTTLEFDSITLPVYTEYINDIYFVDSLRGYMVCGSVYDELSSYILFTQDGGQIWETMKEAQTGMYHCVSFFDRNVGIMGGDEDLYFTRNAGFDWYPAIGIPSRFSAISISITGNVAYVIGTYEYRVGSQKRYKAQIYKSLDYGKEWCLIFEDSNQLEYSYQLEKSMHISFSNENKGVAAYGYNRLIYTENGGGLGECVTGINDLALSKELYIYPNPTENTLTLNLPSASTYYTLSLHDLQGKQLYASQVQGAAGAVVNVSMLPQGIYVLHLKSATGSYTQRVAVQ